MPALSHAVDELRELDYAASMATSSLFLANSKSPCGVQVLCRVEQMPTRLALQMGFLARLLMFPWQRVLLGHGHLELDFAKLWSDAEFSQCQLGLVFLVALRASATAASIAASESQPCLSELFGATARPMAGLVIL